MISSYRGDDDLSEYKYLFPYEQVPHKSRIVIYGAGDLGQEYLKQMIITKYAMVVGFIDKNHKKYDRFIVPVYSPENIKELQFDYVILAFKRGDYINELTDRLVKKGIKKEKIIYQGIRNVNLDLTISERNLDTAEYAYKKSSVSVALKYGPGLGDSIIKKAFYIELVRLLPDVLVDIYAPGGLKFIPSLYSDQHSLNCVVDDGGGLYFENKTKYTLALSVFRLIEVDYIDFTVLEKFNHQFAELMRKHINNHNKYKLSNFPSTQNWIHYGRARFMGWSCYSLYKYTGVFNVEQGKVEIPLDDSKKDILRKYSLDNYITINYGNGAVGKGYKESSNKQWPLKYFSEFIALFKNTYNSSMVVQVGDNSTEKIAGADRYIFGADIEELKFILKGAMLHIDIEGGLVHLATNLGTKCVVLFGPTQEYIYAYPENINIVSSSCSGCYGLYDNAFLCAKDMKEPECMRSITPNIVMERIEQYMKSLYKIGDKG